MDRKTLEKIYLNKKIRINYLYGEEPGYDGKEGIVEYIDDLPSLHGTWGGLSIIPEVDDISIIED